jgi:hypothetical protein
MGVPSKLMGGASARRGVTRQTDGLSGRKLASVLDPLQQSIRRTAAISILPTSTSGLPTRSFGKRNAPNGDVVCGSVRSVSTAGASPEARRADVSARWTTITGRDEESRLSRRTGQLRRVEGLAIKASIHDSSGSTPDKLAASKSRPQPQWPDQRLRRSDFQPWARSCQSVASFARSR